MRTMARFGSARTNRLPASRRPRTERRERPIAPETAFWPLGLNTVMKISDIISDLREDGAVAGEVSNEVLTEQRASANPPVHRGRWSGSVSCVDIW